MKRLVHHNPETGISQFWHQDVEGNVTLQTQQVIDHIAEDNKQQFKEHTSLDRWGDGKKVASIPLSIYYSPEFQAIAKDQKKLKAWLNDRDNQVFRTRPGRV